MSRQPKPEQREIQPYTAQQKIVVRSTTGVVLALSFSCILLLVLQFLS